MERRSREQRGRGGGWVVPLVLGVVVTLLVIAYFRRDQGTPDAAPSPPMIPAVNSFLNCTDCHGDLDEVFKSGERPNLLFTHDAHFALAISDCGACHVPNTHERDKINSPEMATCYACHGLGEDARASGDCALCHPPDMDPEPSSHLVAAWTPTAHAVAAEADPFDCSTCHEQGFCDSCHELEMPHPAGFDGRPHAEGFYADPELCERCHPRGVDVARDDCDTCHHPEGPEDTGWLDYHEVSVHRLGATTCFQCHVNETCRTCHRRGAENFTNEDFEADAAQLAAQGN